MGSRFKTRYPGVFYRITKRIGNNGTEKVYYIVFKKNGKLYEEKVGRQYADHMTPTFASHIRSERIEGKRKSRKEIRKLQELKHLQELNRWTIDRLWQEYKTTHPDIKGLAQDENRFKMYIHPNFGNKEPKELFPFEVDKFRVKLLRQKKPATVRNILEILRRIINFGQNKRLTEPLGFIIEMPRVNNLKTENLTREQLARLLDVLNTYPDIQAADIMKMALFTGMRKGEIFRLKWEDIDFERGFIFIRNPKGGIDQKIPLNLHAKEVLLSHPKTESPYVFPGKDGGPRKEMKRAAHHIRQMAELPEDFRPLHGLRHVFASLLASSGQVDMYTLQKLLTHKSPQMTQRYAHLRDETLKSASNVMDKIVELHQNVQHTAKVINMNLEDH